MCWSRSSARRPSGHSIASQRPPTHSRNSPLAYLGNGRLLTGRAQWRNLQIKGATPYGQIDPFAAGLFATIHRGGNREARLLDVREFVEQLVQKACQEKHREQIEPLLLQGLEGPMTPMTKADWKNIRRRVRERLTKDKKQKRKRA